MKAANQQKVAAAQKVASAENSALATGQALSDEDKMTQQQKENAMQYRITDCLTDIRGNDLDAMIETACKNRWHGKLTIWRWNGRQWKYVRVFEF